MGRWSGCCRRHTYGFGVRGNSQCVVPGSTRKTTGGTEDKIGSATDKREREKKEKKKEEEKEKKKKKNSEERARDTRVTESNLRHPDELSRR